MQMPTLREVRRQRVTLCAVRSVNTYESAGVFERSQQRLDSLVVDHLMTVRWLAGMREEEAMLLRMSAEGFSRREIAAAMGKSRNQIDRMVGRMRTAARA
jgi:DNA-directed RNA polymerase specialized sigma24 family protein